MQNKKSNGSEWFVAALAILFIGLKLTGHIDWSWWWVLAPLWMPIVVGIGFIVLFFVGYAIFSRRR